MSLMRVISAVSLLLAAMAANADFEPWKDYEISEEVYLVTTIKVDSNMEDVYLEGISRTWIPSNEVAKELGQIKDYAIYRNQLPDSGDFNMILTITLHSAADMQFSKERYDAFMRAIVEEMGEQAVDESNEFAQQNYPAMREITGEYMMRRITVN